MNPIILSSSFATKNIPFLIYSLKYLVYSKLLDELGLSNSGILEIEMTCFISVFFAFLISINQLRRVILDTFNYKVVQ